jgi:hypothetical protein
MGKLVGLVGRARSGKDTFADVLESCSGFARVAIAERLKQDLCTYLGIGYDQLVREKPQLRRALQLRGECARKLLGDMFWINALMQQILTLREHGVPVVVTDVRLPGEAAWIANCGGILVKQVRTDARIEFVPSHDTEDLVDSIRCHYVCTAGSFEERVEKARRFVADLDGIVMLNEREDVELKAGA